MRLGVGRGVIRAKIRRKSVAWLFCLAASQLIWHTLRTKTSSKSNQTSSTSTSSSKTKKANTSSISSPKTSHHGKRSSRRRSNSSTRHFHEPKRANPVRRSPQAPQRQRRLQLRTRNYVSLVLDSQTTDFTNLKPVREGAIKYVREQITDADAVAILSVTNGLQMLQPFTQDKAKLIASLENLGSPDSKSFEQKDIAENIANLRDFLNNALQHQRQASRLTPADLPRRGS